MPSIPGLSFSVNPVTTASVAANSNADKTYTHALGTEGDILLVSGNSFNDQLAYTPFNNSSDITLLNSLGPTFPQALQTVDVKLNLVAGEKLSIHYDYYPGDAMFNDFAFGMLKDPTGKTTGVVGATNAFGAKTGDTSYQMTFSVTASGSYNLLMGVADVGDTEQPSSLFIDNVSIDVPAGGYTLGTTGVQLSDGSELNPDGSVTSAGGTTAPGLLSQGARNAITTLDTDFTSHLIGEDGSSLIGEDGSSLIGEDGSSLISQDGNGLISQGGNGLVSNASGTLVSNASGTLVSNASGTLIGEDGSSLVQISPDANPVLAQEGTGIISQDGNGVISNDGGSFAQLAGAGAVGSAVDIAERLSAQDSVARTFSNTPVPPPSPGAGVPGAEFAVSPLTSYVSEGFKQILALPNGQFVLAYAEYKQQSEKFVGLDVQLLNANGTPAAPLFRIDTSSVLINALGSVGLVALPGGGYGIAYGEYDQAGTPPYGVTPNLFLQSFDSSGAAVGASSVVGQLTPGDETIAAAMLSDGSFVILQVQDANGSGQLATVAQRYTASGVAEGPAISVASNDGTGYITETSAVGLQSSTFAVAYFDATAGRSKGLYYQTINADGSQNTPIFISASGNYPSMAVLTDGNVAIAWGQNDGTHVQVVTAAGVKVGSEAVGLPLTETDNSIAPAITALSDGRFLVANTILNGTMTAGQAQIYNADGTVSGGPIAAGSTGTFYTVAAQLAGGTVEVVSTQSLTLQNGVYSTGENVVADPITFAGTATTAIAVPTQGRATDGYISGATVFADANGNGVLDTGEASATTDAFGRFTFATTSSGPLVMTGGIDTSTGLAVTQTLTAPAGATSVTPLSTLVQKLVAGGATLTAAELAVNNALGLAAATDATAFDPVLETLRSLSGGTQGLVAASTIADTVAIATAAGVTGDVYAKLAAEIAASSGPFDPTTVAAMQNLGLTGLVAQAASLLAAAAQALATQKVTADATAPLAVVNDTASVEKVEQGAAATALAAGVASNNLASAVAMYTGASFLTAVAGSQGSTLPDVSASFTPAVYAVLQTTLAALQPSGTVPSVVSVAGGGSASTATGGVLNAYVVTLAGAGAGSTAPAGYAAGYLLSGAGTLQDANGGAALIDAAGGGTLLGSANDTLFGGNGNETIVAGAGAETVYGGTGTNLIELGTSNVLANTQGTDTIVGTSGSATINATGAPIYFGGAGSAIFNALGAAATLVGGGAQTVNANGAAIEMFAGSGLLTFNAGSGLGTVISGSGGASLTGGTGGLLYFGTGPSSYIAGSAVDTVLGFTGSLSATGGSNGTLFFSGTAGHSNISSGTGSSTIVGIGTADLLTATGPGNDIISATGAADTISGSTSSGTNAYFAFGNGDVVTGGNGLTAIESLLGSQTLVAGAGSTLFEIVASGQRAIDIGGFNPATDFVQLQGYNVGAAAAAQSTATTISGNEVLSLSDGTKITFQGVTGLTATPFL